MGASRGGHDLGYWTMMLRSPWLGVFFFDKGEHACTIAPITHTNECNNMIYIYDI